MNCRRVTFVFVPLALIMGCSQQDASPSGDAPPSPAASSPGGPTPRVEHDSNFAIVKLDPAVDAIVSPHAMLETLDSETDGQGLYITACTHVYRVRLK
jgi:hypothetical protein